MEAHTRAPWMYSHIYLGTPWPVFFDRLKLKRPPCQKAPCNSVVTQTLGWSVCSNETNLSTCTAGCSLSKWWMPGCRGLEVGGPRTWAGQSNVGGYL